MAAFEIFVTGTCIFFGIFTGKCVCLMYYFIYMKQNKLI